ncbi:16S rRNA methyltransferase [Bifidobacterium dolichotidis]|uniref:Ribosomal RNA small subunit methyltransferase G n=2 Tax=Bifidobacterium dolichotidis TaxID=2306976 RepID=A0A430FNX1_9BIFI|nr:16S rRNA (guanine(527)-N(7))-methyltransferase RsmG [Bifidobacterium dolichotidis]RSX54532.1 16S rRNA methyltransferase [Bifidobacterium dolichotidis]
MAEDSVLAGSKLLTDVFGEALPKVQAFYAKLDREGEERGLIGPRDQNILWERHLLNSAAVVPFIRKALHKAQFKTVADVGSGGGFPGLVAAAMLPDVSFTLIEPMERRCAWLNECIEEMGLQNTVVVRARAEEAIGAIAQAHGHKSKVDVPQEVAEAISHPFSVVTCRAVAPMTKLSGWALPLVATGGKLIALKGRSAQAEITKAAKQIAHAGGVHARVEEAPVAEGLEPTHVVIVDKRAMKHRR